MLQAKSVRSPFSFAFRVGAISIEFYCIPGLVEYEMFSSDSQNVRSEQECN